MRSGQAERALKTVFLSILSLIVLTRIDAATAQEDAAKCEDVLTQLVRDLDGAIKKGGGDRKYDIALDKYLPVRCERSRIHDIVKESKNFTCNSTLAGIDFYDFEVSRGIGMTPTQIQIIYDINSKELRRNIVQSKVRHNCRQR